MKLSDSTLGRSLGGLGPRRGSGLHQWVQVLPFLFPTLVGMLLFTHGAVLAAFFISLTRWDAFTPWVWVGLDNYKDLFAADTLFTRSMIQTAYYTLVSVPLGIVAALLAAVLVNQKLRFMTFYRTVFFLPGITSIVAVAMVWLWLYNPDFGVINWLLGMVNIDGPPWLGSTKWAMPAVIIFGVWRGLGYNMVILLAGLQGIPDVYYEAAEVDGASKFRRFWHITLPLLSPTTFFVLIISLIGSFQVFEQTYVLTEGGPAYATMTIAYYIFLQAFQWFHMGIASALAFMLFLAVMVVTVLQFSVQRKWVHYD